MGVLFPIALAGAAAYYWREKLGLTKWFDTLRSTTLHVLSMDNAGGPSPGQATPLPVPPGAPAPQIVPFSTAGDPVATSSTATESGPVLRLVNPAVQPRVPSVAQEQVARMVAPRIEAALIANPDGPGYISKNQGLKGLIQQFQAAVNLTTDGLYGPQAAGALMYFLGHSPPPPFFYGAPPDPPERVIKVYLPQ